MFTRNHLRVTSLVALFVLLWGLLLPTLANAGMGAANDAWIEICTAQGIKKIQQDGDPASAPGHQSAGHCLLCCLGGALPGVDVPSPQAVLFAPVGVVLPQPVFVFPLQLVLLTAPPRAPPVLPH